MKMRLLGRLLLVVFLGLHLSVGRACAESRSTRVILIFDVSGSFKKWHDQAWEHIDREMKRLRRHGNDELVLIRLDRHPEIIFDGKLELLKKARSQFAELAEVSNGCCTDVAGALNLAAFRLGQSPAPGQKEIWIVSDLIHEPKGRPVPPPEEIINWEGLKGAAVRVYFIPPKEAMTWSDIFARHGIQAEVFNPAQSENVTVEMATPVRPEGQGSILMGLVKLAIYGFPVYLIAVMMPRLWGFFWNRIHRRSRQST